MGNKEKLFKRLKNSFCYKQISLTGEFVVAGFNCITTRRKKETVPIPAPKPQIKNSIYGKLSSIPNIHQSPFPNTHPSPNPHQSTIPILISEPSRTISPLRTTTEISVPACKEEDKSPKNSGKSERWVLCRMESRPDGSRTWKGKENYFKYTFFFIRTSKFLLRLKVLILRAILASKCSLKCSYFLDDFERFFFL